MEQCYVGLTNKKCVNLRRKFDVKSLALRADPVTFDAPINLVARR